MLIALPAMVLGIFCPLPVLSAPQTLKVVMDDNYPPYVFRDAAGELVGVLVDQWRLWEKKTGVTVEISAKDWARAQQEMQAGRYDVIDTIFKNPNFRFFPNVAYEYHLIYTFAHKFSFNFSK